MQEFVRIHPDDMVAVALRPLSAGSSISMDGKEIVLLEDIPQGHKFALRDIGEGEEVAKYGAPIGIAKSEIRQGAWVHTHNMKTGLGDLLTYTYEPQINAEQAQTNEDDSRQPQAGHCFQGFRRPDGKVGVRNEIWIIPTVGCVNNVAAAIEKRAQSCVKGSVEAVTAFAHPYGCSQMGEDQENTRRILADLTGFPVSRPIRRLVNFPTCWLRRAERRSSRKCRKCSVRRLF